MQNYDILGLFSPLNLRLKLAYQRNLLKYPDLGWEENLPTENRELFVEALKQILHLNDRGLPRSVVPRYYSKPPWLIGFYDGSGQAVGASAYVRFKLRDGSHQANLLTSKSKIAGVRTITTPKAELLGCTMVINMLDYIIRNMDLQFQRTIVLTASTVVYGQIQKPACLYDGNVGSKIDHSQEMRKEHNLEVYHVPGEYNVADMVTRGHCTVDNVLGPKWIEGGFLKNEFNDWPISKNIKVLEN